MAIFIVEAPSAEPVSLEELRLHCRIDDDYLDENDLLRTYISAAREYCEEYTGRHFAEKTLGLSGHFPKGKKAFELSPNLNAILFIEYSDAEGSNTSMNLNTLFVDNTSIYGAVTPKENWPSTESEHPYPVTIHFESGGGECPLSVKQSILLLASHWYQNREGSTIGVASKEAEYSVHLLLGSLRVVNV